ncbi:TPA: immunoglobulin domain-containing protein [Enterobacter hormaechei]
MVDVIKRRTTGVDDANDDGQVEIVMENISPASFSTALPATKSVTAGQSLTLTVAVTGGQTPYSYQWFKDGNAISGANAATYTKASAAAADSGAYKVVVQDGYGNIISGASTVTVS